MNEGSDCPTGKEQLTREGADDKVRSLRAADGDRRVKRYRCPLCSCFHVGHSRKIDSRRARGSQR